MVSRVLLVLLMLVASIVSFTTTAAAAAVPPGQPSIGAVSSGSRTDTAVSVTASWRASNTGGAATSYLVTAIRVTTGARTTVPAAAVARSQKISTLVPGAAYAVEVVARNAAGVGPASARSRLVVAQ